MPTRSLPDHLGQRREPGASPYLCPPPTSVAGWLAAPPSHACSSTTPVASPHPSVSPLPLGKQNTLATGTSAPSPFATLGLSKSRTRAGAMAAALVTCQGGGRQPAQGLLAQTHRAGLLHSWLPPGEEELWLGLQCQCGHRRERGGAANMPETPAQDPQPQPPAREALYDNPHCPEQKTRPPAPAQPRSTCSAVQSLSAEGSARRMAGLSAAWQAGMWSDCTLLTSRLLKAQGFSCASDRALLSGCRVLGATGGPAGGRAPFGLAKVHLPQQESPSSPLGTTNNVRASLANSCRPSRPKTLEHRPCQAVETGPSKAGQWPDSAEAGSRWTPISLHAPNPFPALVAAGKGTIPVLGLIRRPRVTVF